MTDQPTFADLDYQVKKRKTRREEFLERMDSLIPWEKLEERIRPHYFRGQRGRRPYPLSVMLRVHIVQLCYNPFGKLRTGSQRPRHGGLALRDGVGTALCRTAVVGTHPR